MSERSRNEDLEGEQPTSFAAGPWPKTWRRRHHRRGSGGRHPDSRSSTAVTSRTIAKCHATIDAVKARRQIRTSSWSDCRIPGGRVTDGPAVCSPYRPRIPRDLREWHPCGSRRGKAIQFHGVLKRHLQATIAGRSTPRLLNNLGACGDVERNVICRARSPSRSPLRSAAELAARRSRHLRRASGAYHEIWLNGDQDASIAGRGRADLRQDLPAAQVQDRPRPAAATTASTSTPRTSASWPSSRTARSSATTCWSAAAWA